MTFVKLHQGFCDAKKVEEHCGTELEDCMQCF